MRDNRVVLEVCVESVESALAAEQGGADRIELCGALAVGGITPGPGLVRQCLSRVRIPIMMMVRPRPGPFTCADDDVAAMRADIGFARSVGVAGVVFGCLTPQGDVPAELVRTLVREAGPLQKTFHRAFDVARNPLETLDLLIACGVHRLLTSGQAPSALEGAALIRQLHERAAGRLTVIAGSGVTSANARLLLDRTGVRELHASASRGPTPPTPQPSAVAPGHTVTDVREVRALRTAVAAT